MSAAANGTTTEFVYNAAGQRVSEWNASTHVELKGHYYWGAKPVAFYTTASGGGAALHFEHQDWLGTERMRTSYNGGVEGTYQSLPWGDGQSSSGSDQDAYHYATLDYDSESNTSHAQFRQYSSTEGRFLSPDPFGGSYNPANPQSFNRYEYAMDNPLSNIDPNGLNCQDGWYSADEEGDCFPGVPGFGGGGGAGAGGVGGYGGGMGHYVWFPNWQYGCDYEYGDRVNCRWVDEGTDVWIATGPLMNFMLASAAYGGGGGGGAPNKSGCQAGPLNLSQNIQTAKALAGQFWSGLLNSASPGGAASAGAAAGTYVGLVQTGGAWDPKNGPGGPTPENVAAGNINFGATCSQFGFNTWLGGQVCQFGAGIYGKLTGNYGSPLFSPSHGDWPLDNQQIRQGLAIAKKGGC